MTDKLLRFLQRRTVTEPTPPLCWLVLYLQLWQWVELPGQVSHRSVELESHWLSWGWAPEWRTEEPADCDWSAGMKWGWYDCRPPGWNCWFCQAVDREVGVDLPVFSRVSGICRYLYCMIHAAVYDSRSCSRYYSKIVTGATFAAIS